jgi:hypothetical protein
VKEGHVASVCGEEPGGIEACFVELTHEYLAKIAPRVYERQVLPK